MGGLRRVFQRLLKSLETKTLQVPPDRLLNPSRLIICSTKINIHSRNCRQDHQLSSIQKYNMNTNRAINLRKKLGKSYPFGGPDRLFVPREKMNWDEEWSEYNPPAFTIPGILKGDKLWADPEISVNGCQFKWNEIDNKLSRKSWEGEYQIDENGYPLNPVGRTGIRGRGSLGKWGPNHAADAIVTRWKTEAGKIVCKEKKPVLQFVAILRQDTGELAIPGGMIEPGEDPYEAAKRECLEEVFGLEEATPERKILLESELKDIFEQKLLVYKGYVDDRRSTDNAWIETYAVNYHLEDGNNAIEKVEIRAGSDAKSALWVDIHGLLNLYASHNDLIKRVVELHKAYFGID